MHLEGQVQSHAGSPVAVQSPGGPGALVNCFCGFSYHILNPLALVIPPPSLGIDSQKSAQYLAVGLCMCLNQLLNGGFIMTIRVVTNMIRKESQF